MKNEKTAVSIVVPVYNTEMYLGEMLDSLLEQNFSAYEIILVDDGSTDNSGKICDDYALIDDRIQVYHKANEGISATRNFGLSKAYGEFVLFVDSDDIVVPEYIENLVKAIDDCDAVACGYYCFNEGNTDISLKNTSIEKTYVGHNQIVEAYDKEELKKYFYTPWAILFRRSSIHGTFNENLEVAEDIVFNLNFLKDARKIKLINFCGYGLRKRSDSTTTVIDKRYSRLYEHDYRIILDAIFLAKKEMGIEQVKLDQEKFESAPMRYFHEITNLFREGSPYSRREAIRKISTIHQDKEFLSCIRRN